MTAAAAVQNRDADDVECKRLTKTSSYCFFAAAAAGHYKWLGSASITMFPSDFGARRSSYGLIFGCAGSIVQRVFHHFPYS